jgi:hypothetical protein
MNNVISSPEWRRLSPDARAVLTNHQSEYPINVSRICADFGVDILLASLPTRISGEIRPGGTGFAGYTIKVNRYEAEVRQRFTAAHELSHFLLHKDKILTGIVDSVLYRSNLSNSLEAEANRLAADILMPPELITASLQGLPLHLIDETIITDLASRFRVSKAAMGFRLGVS